MVIVFVDQEPFFGFAWKYNKNQVPHSIMFDIKIAGDITIAHFHESEVPSQSGAGAVVLPNVIQLLDKSLVESCNVDMHSKLIPADTHKTSLEMILDADAKIMTSMPIFRFIKHPHDSTVSTPAGKCRAFPALHVWECMGETNLRESSGILWLWKNHH